MPCESAGASPPTALRGISPTTLIPQVHLFNENNQKVADVSTLLRRHLPKYLCQRKCLSSDKMKATVVEEEHFHWNFYVRGG